MAQLQSLPQELLIWIARYVDNHDRCNLARICRNIAAATQELLYKAPVYLRNGVRTPLAPDSSSYLPHRDVYKLVRTLLERKDLVKHVQNVDLCFSVRHRLRLTGEKRFHSKNICSK